MPINNFFPGANGWNSPSASTIVASVGAARQAAAADQSQHGRCIATLMRRWMPNDD
jgi:hypothetical protein